MKIVRFEWHGNVTWGILEDSSIYSIDGELYGQFDKGRQICVLGDVKLLAPAEPRITVACGLNYKEVIEQLGQPAPQEPALFFKPPNTILDPEGDIVYPPISQQLTYEAELCCVMKRRAKNVPEEKALDYVLGYTCGNDCSLMDLFKKDGRLTRSKGFDTSGPLGPVIATGLDPHKLRIQGRVNGKQIQDGNTGDMIFSPERIISHISNFMTLEAGDVVWTGTPAGGHYPVNIGDVIEVEIDGIGLLRNRVVAPR
jgi:2-keto-4-pentenoate hydratase/2-oxohepta-3-ene-1,7-dioic acid hydratase in catechol pathway